MSVPTTAADEVPAKLSTLTGQDRCDRCGAQAYTQVFLRGLDLLFCHHHSQMFMSTLVEIADEITVVPVPA